MHLELLMRAADMLSPLHISSDHLNPGSQNLVLVTGSRIQLAMFVSSHQVYRRPIAILLAMSAAPHKLL